MSSFAKVDTYPDGLREIDVATLSSVPVDKIHLVDVREPDEWVGPLGHVAGAELVPMATVAAKAKADGWKPDDELVLICKSGGRSAHVGRALIAQGFKHVINVRGGMMAWNGAGLPTTK